LVALCEGGGLGEALPEIVEAIQPAAVLAPVEEPAWFPPEVQERLATFLRARHIPCGFPSPFCALVSGRGESITAFARYFGRPHLEIVTDRGRILAITVLPDTPCGFVGRAAQELVGVPVKQAEDRARACQARCPRAAAGGAPCPSFAPAVGLALGSFDAVVAAYGEALLKQARAWTKDPQEAEDLVQETLCRAFDAWLQFTPGTEPGAWLWRILENLIHYKHRQQEKAPVVLSWEDLSPDEEQILAEEVPLGDRPEPACLAEVLSSEWEATLNSLRPKLREALWLSVVEGLSHREIAAHLGIRVEAVDQRVSRAKAQLRAALGRGPGVAR
jgi:RNA polymerase sigma-70 factor (ECF subfamily)